MKRLKSFSFDLNVYRFSSVIHAESKKEAREILERSLPDSVDFEIDWILDPRHDPISQDATLVRSREVQIGDIEELPEDVGFVRKRGNRIVAAYCSRCAVEESRRGPLQRLPISKIVAVRKGRRNPQECDGDNGPPHDISDTLFTD